MPDERILRLSRDIERIVQEQDYIKKKMELVENLIQENETIKAYLANIEEKLSLIDTVLEENRFLKEKIAQLEEKIKKQPSRKKKSVKLDYIFTGISKAVDSFEKGSKVAGGKKFVISDIQMELKGLVSPERGELKLVIPEEPEELPPEILSRINFRLSPSISYEEEWIEIPNLIGTDKDDAVKKLEELGFRVDIQEVETNFPSGIVVKIVPEPYVEARQGTEVVLYVSK
ncbi:PASTA domain-containing protein [Persephonella sp.]